MKQNVPTTVLNSIQHFNVKLGRYRPDDQILAFLKDL